VGVATGLVDVGSGRGVDVGGTRVGVAVEATGVVGCGLGVEAGGKVAGGVAVGASGVINRAVGATIVSSVGVFVASAVVASGDGVAALASCSWSCKSVAANRKATETVRTTTTSAPRLIASFRGSNCLVLLLELDTVNNPEHRN